MWRNLEYYWRLVATGLSFAIFGLGGLMASLTLFNAIRLLPRSRQSKRRISQGLVHRLFRFYIRLMKVMGVLTVDVKGKRELATSQGQVILANHPSLLDVVILISLVPRANCLIKESLQHNIFMRGIIAAAGYIGNGADSTQVLQQCQQVLSEGDNLIIFPEGTRSTPGQPLSLRRGAAQIAVRSQALVMPVHIQCHPTTLTKSERWYQIPEQRAHFSVTVMAPIVSTLDQVDASESRQARRLTQYLQDLFNKAQGSL